jgi:DNA-binding FadR family transcriptional regulator
LTKALTLTHQVAQQLTRDIGDGVYAVGTKLPSGKDLASRFGVSQSVIREVTERLRAHGLVDSRQGAGCTVTARTQSGGFRVSQAIGADLSAVYELRLDLEGASAALAAVRRTDVDIEALESILKSLADNLYTPEPAVELDIAFHVAIAHATHNRYYVELLQYLNLQIRQAVQTARTYSLARERLPDEVHREHVRIFEAIRAGDALAAREAATSHLRSAASRLGLDISGRDLPNGASTPPIANT